MPREGHVPFGREAASCWQRAERRKPAGIRQGSVRQTGGESSRIRPGGPFRSGRFRIPQVLRPQGFPAAGNGGGGVWAGLVEHGRQLKRIMVQVRRFFQ